MSSISITGSDQSLLQFYQQISSNSAAPPTVAAAASASVTDSSSGDSDSGVQGAQSSGGHHHGHGGLFKKVESAVTSALQAAKSNPNADPNQVVEDAIAKVFKDAGQAPAAAGATRQDASQPNHPDAGAGDASSARGAFFQTLQAFGISASQFHSDFVAAVKGAQQGESDSSSLFANFPPGSSVDTTA